MREILFRGRSVITGEWLYGWYGKCNGKDYIIASSVAWFEVIPETRCQYIGQTDKNGTKIFEGDIVKIEVAYGEGYNSRSVTGAIAYDGMGYLGVIVEYCDGHPVWSDIICELELSGAIEDYCFEVIGNIYDNTELIGGKDNALP